METFSAWLAICVGNSPVTREFPAQKPVTRSFDVFFDLRLNERLNREAGDLRRHSGHCDVTVMMKEKTEMWKFVKYHVPGLPIALCRGNSWFDFEWNDVEITPVFTWQYMTRHSFPFRNDGMVLDPYNEFKIQYLLVKESRDRLIFNMGISIPETDNLYIETGSWLPDIRALTIRRLIALCMEAWQI